MDWNNGPGPQYYPVRDSYGSGSTLHRQFVKKLMMLGSLSPSSIHVDLPSGPVYGVYYTRETAPDGTQYNHYRLGMVPTGLDSLNRQPSHE